MTLSSTGITKIKRENQWVLYTRLRFDPSLVKGAMRSKIRLS